MSTKLRSVAVTASCCAGLFFGVSLVRGQQDDKTDRQPTTQPDTPSESDYNTQPPVYPVSFLFHDGLFYHYELSCCEPTGDPSSQHWGIVTSEEPIADQPCGTSTPVAAQMEFPGEPDKFQEGAAPPENLDWQSFRGWKNAGGAMPGVERPKRLYQIGEGPNALTLRFRVRNDAVGLKDKYFVLYCVEMKNVQVGPAAPGRNLTVYFAIEDDPNDLRYDRGPYHAVDVNLVRNVSGKPEVRAKYKGGADAPLARAVMRTPNRAQLPGSPLPYGVPLDVYFVMLEGADAWGKPQR